jgi:hypothetical protein
MTRRGLCAIIRLPFVSLFSRFDESVLITRVARLARRRRTLLAFGPRDDAFGASPRARAIDAAGSTVRNCAEAGS